MDVEQLELLYTGGGNVKLYSCFKTVWQFVIQVKMHLAHYPKFGF